MPHDKGQARLVALNRQMQDLVSSFPRATSELIDFHFKSTVDEYLRGIQQVRGRKLLLVSETPSQIRESLPKVLLLGDLIMFNCAAYMGAPALSFFPISDDHRSPALGMMASIGPDGRATPPRPVEVAYLAAVLSQRTIESPEPVRLLGCEWIKSGKRWERSEFTRTSEPFQNDRAEKCHIAAGFIHVQLPKEDTLLTELIPLLEDGQVVFAPFVKTGSDADLLCEGALKAGLMDASLVLDGTTLRTSSGSIHPLTQLEIPYLDGIPLPLLSRIIRDEHESIAKFRLALNRAIEDIEETSDAGDAARVVKRLQRDLLEDELNKVRQVYERVSRMNAVARVGAYVSTAALSVAAVLGLAPPSIVCGAAGVATATFAQLYKSFEDKRELRKSPMHFVWRIESRVC